MLVVTSWELMTGSGTIAIVADASRARKSLFQTGLRATKTKSSPPLNGRRSNQP
jgi:hypothetical protein